MPSSPKEHCTAINPVNRITREIFENSQHGLPRTPIRQENALAMIDQRSIYPIVEITTNANAKNLIYILNKSFTHFGYPENLVADNGPPFKSNEILKNTW